MEKLTVEGLANFLKGHLEENLVVLLKDQNVAGIDFIGLDESDLKLFGFSLGHVLQMKRLKAEIAAGRVCVPSEGEDDESDSDDALLEYMDEEEISELSSYQKACYKNQLQNYNLLASKGLPVGSKPTFVKTQQPLKQSAASNTQAVPSVITSVSSASGKSSGASRGRAQKRLIRTRKNKDSSEDDLDENDENIFHENKDDMHKPPVLKRTKQELEEVKPHLTSSIFDVEKVLQESSKTQSLVQLLQNGFILKSQQRKLIFRTLMNHLCKKHLNHPNDVTSTMMEMLAKGFCVKYPQYQKPIDVPNQTPWSHIFAPGGKGHFGNILKRIQCSLPSEERKRKGKAKKPKTVDTRADQAALQTAQAVNISALALVYPGRSQREEILQGMKDTFVLRKSAREKGESIESLLAKYPHFLNYQGDLITQEFQLMFPDVKDMCPLFESHIPKIFEKWSECEITSKCKDDTIKACLIVAQKLPHIIHSKRTRNVSELPALSPKEEEIIVVLRPSDDIDDYISNRVETTTSAIQPYLIAVVSEKMKGVLKFFMILDEKPMELGKIPTVRAIDWLFKACFVFNVHYPNTWTNFFRLLQTCYYEVYLHAEDDAPASAIELFRIIAET